MISVSARTQEIKDNAQLAIKLVELAEQVEAGREARPALFKLIRFCVRDKNGPHMQPSDVADLTGYTRQRIWQICNMKEVEGGNDKNQVGSGKGHRDQQPSTQDAGEVSPETPA